MVIRGKSEVDLAYFAGIIDGEGSIGLEKTSTNVQRRVNAKYQSGLIVVNSDRGMIDWIEDMFGGSVNVRKKQKEYHKQTWRWKVGDQKAAAIIRMILPYLKTKRKLGELLIEYVETTPPKPAGPGAKLSTEEVARREYYYQLFKAINDDRHPQRLTEEATKVDVIV